jgi:hypothetical protein
MYGYTYINDCRAAGGVAMIKFYVINKFHELLKSKASIMTISSIVEKNQQIQQKIGTYITIVFFSAE